MSRCKVPTCGLTEEEIRLLDPSANLGGPSGNLSGPGADGKFGGPGAAGKLDSRGAATRRRLNQGPNKRSKICVLVPPPPTPFFIVLKDAIIKYSQLIKETLYTHPENWMLVKTFALFGVGMKLFYDANKHLKACVRTLPKCVPKK